MLQDMDKRFSHTIVYDIGGNISIDRQLGHDNVTGAVKYQQIRGYGEISKIETVRMAAHIIHVDETTDWQVPANALGNLRVTTVIDLASRPMVEAIADYSDVDYDIKAGDIINVYDPAVVDGSIPVKRLTQQIWATSLATNPGNIGSYHAEFLAAYGPGPYEADIEEINGIPFTYDEDYLWFWKDDVYWRDRDHRSRGYERGDYYVGNFFNIEQYAHTSGGEMRRLISISNPFEISLLEEDAHVVGSASIRESFDTHGLKGGPKAITLAWYELF
ncbi:MAG: hypothetical protein K0B16_07180 [Burkholderiaceae bacterium]|nr:hypothetical protein [Burkholderiaceae bacterium]